MIFCFVLVWFGFWDRILLCRPDWPWSHDPPASTSWLLGLQVCLTTPSITCYFTGGIFNEWLLLQQTWWQWQQEYPVHGRSPVLLVHGESILICIDSVTFSRQIPGGSFRWVQCHHVSVPKEQRSLLSLP
jgi:hypothetical protein